MAAIPWARYEKAIHAWVVAGTGLPTDQVYFTYRGTPKKVSPRVAMTIDFVKRAGQDQLVYDAAPEVDPDPQQDTRVRAQGLRSALLRLQCFAVEDTGRDARVLLENVQAVMPFHNEALNDAGVGILEMEAVQPMAGKGGVLEPRAITEIRINVPSEVEARLGSIAEVTVTAEEIKNDSGEGIDAFSFVVPEGDAFDESFSSGFGG